MSTKGKNNIKGGVKHLFSILTTSENRVEDSFRCDSLMACANILSIPALDMLEEIDSWGNSKSIESALNYLDRVLNTSTGADTLVDYVEESGQDASEVLDVVSEVWPSSEVGTLTGLITRDWTGE